MSPPRTTERLRVAIDAVPLLGDRTGIGHVTANLIGALAQRDDLELVAFAVSRKGRKLLAGQLPPGVRTGSSPLPARFVRPLWEHVSFPRAEHWTGPVDVMHGTNFVAPPSKAPVVVTVHDLTFVHDPLLVSEDTRRFHEPLLRRAIDAGATIHVVSDFVGDEVRDVFSLPPDRVIRVYPGLADTAGGDAAAGRRAVGAPYVLALGQLEPRKNFPRLIQAFDQVSGAHPGLVLALAGPDGWGRREVDAAIANMRHPERVRLLGYVRDEERRDLLAGASAFAYPSLYEGFGHPPLEAMAAGVPVVTTTAGAVPEVVGDAALLVDPLQIEEIAQQLARVLDDEGLRAQLRVRGRARVATFSWPRAGDEFASLYRSVAAGASSAQSTDRARRPSAS